MIIYLTFYISTLTFFVRVNPYTVSSRPLTTKAHVKFQILRLGFMVNAMGLLQDFLQKILFFLPVPIINISPLTLYHLSN
jgi:hypothetical protein